METFKTMLAKPANYSKFNFDGAVLQTKLDGMRCYITKDGMFSRAHKPVLSAPHIIKALKPFFDEYGDDVILDGELYNHKFADDFNKIISLARKTKPTQEHLKESAALLQFHCYDMYPVQDPGMTYLDRKEFITREVINKMYGVYPVETIHIYNEEDVAKFHKRFLASGYEGSIMREDAPYEQKRSSSLMKVKDFFDEEATIVDFVEGKGKLEGHVGKFIAKSDCGITFGCPPGLFSFEDRKEMWENREDYLGQRITFEHFGKTPGNKSFRHPMGKAIRNYE